MAVSLSHLLLHVKSCSNALCVFYWWRSTILRLNWRVQNPTSCLNIPFLIDFLFWFAMFSLVNWWRSSVSNKWLFTYLLNAVQFTLLVTKCGDRSKWLHASIADGLPFVSSFNDAARDLPRRLFPSTLDANFRGNWLTYMMQTWSALFKLNCTVSEVRWAEPVTLITCHRQPV